MAQKAKVVVYGTEFCSYCLAARMLLKRKGVAFEDVLVSKDPELRRRMEEASGHRTVPQIFIDDTPVGGFDELAALDADGRLDELLGALE